MSFEEKVMARLPEHFRRKSLADLTQEELSAVCAAVVAIRRWGHVSKKDRVAHASRMGTASAASLTRHERREKARIAGTTRAVKAQQKLRPKV